MSHIPVLKNEVIDALKIIKGEWYIDATLGAGGHSVAILDAGGKVLGIDQDKQAIKLAKQNLVDYSDSVIFHQGNFSQISQILKSHDLEKVSGILFDLGASSMQFDTPERGFSFNHDAPLDMRMDTKTTTTAQDLVNNLSEKELYALFVRYSQEQRARQIANAIIRARRLEPIKTTKQLAHLITEEIGDNRAKSIHPATKVFQALRMEVNQETEVLKNGLEEAINLLSSGGILAVISFHETEDRIVKQTLNKQKKLINQITKKPIVPSHQEVRLNPRSRSAKLRVYESKNKE